MDAMECIFSRTSVRSFQNRDVDDKVITEILKAGMAAPSAVNMQPWMFVVVRERALLDKLADRLPYTKMAAQATVAVVVCGDLRKTIDQREQEYWVEDCSAATQNILLAAHALGLGAVWTAVYPVSERVNTVLSILEFPEYLVPLNVIPIGYSGAAGSPKNKWDPDKVIWK
ncbi:MAG: nitroreductase family protein [Sediminispirochaetaceae bacterium]